MIIKIMRIALLCASMYGYMREAGRRIAPELSIGFTFAAIGSVMTVAGVLNVLPEAAVLICAGGLACLVRGIAKDRRMPPLNWGVAFLAVMCAVLTARLYGLLLIHNDNFSHWGVIVRHMLVKDRLPNYADPYIWYQSYPPGSAAFIYYCLKITGVRAEWAQMLAHWMCAAGMLSGLFCLAKGVPAKLACFAGAMLVFCGDNNFNQLLVDSTLALVTAEAVCFCVYYRRDLRKKAPYLIPWLTYLIALKNSGGLFVLYALILVFFWGGFKRGAVCAVPPLMMLLIWNRHVSYVFESGMTTRHSMSIDNFRRMLSAKKPGSVNSIVRQLLQRVFSLTNEYLAVLIFSIALFILAMILLRRDRLIRGLLIYGAAAYAIYMAGTLGMYIFTMPEGQAVQLASYDRYHGTISMFCASVALMAALVFADRAREKPKGGMWGRVCCLGCVAAIAVSGMPEYTHYTRILRTGEQGKLPIRLAADEVIAECGIPPEASYYVLVGDDFAATPYLTNLMNCLLMARDIQVRRIKQILDENEAFKSDYLIAFEDVPQVMDYVEEHFGARERFIDLSTVARDADGDVAETPAAGNLAALMAQSKSGGSEAEEKKSDASGNLAELMKQSKSGGNDVGKGKQTDASGNLAELMKQSKAEG